MADSRERILKGIRQSLTAARHLPGAPRVALTPDPPVTREALAARFAQELALVGGVCERLADPAGVAARVCALAREAGAAEGGVLAWGASELPLPGLHSALGAQGLALLGGDLPHAEPARAAALQRLEAARVGLTGVDAAFAETGTLALRSGPGRPRLASLSVSTHIAVMTPDQLWPSWAAWWASLKAPEWVAGASNLTLITGPSRTADIEMTLTVGVHGPRYLYVIVAG